MDIFAGFCVGWSEVLVGYPFLTAKVLVQNGHSWWGHPLHRYYQGVRYPLVSSVGFNTVVFPLKERLYPYTGSYFVSGALAGMVVAPQMYFIDTFTIRRQTNQGVGLRMFRGSRGFGMTLGREVVALSTYFGVYHKPGKPKPYQAQVRRGGTTVQLGSFATAEAAALCIARTPEGQAAAKRAAAPPPLTSEEARQQAEAEGLTLLRSEDGSTGYRGVYFNTGKTKPYEAQVQRGGQNVYLGQFATAEEAALREVYEETAVRCELVLPLGVVRYPLAAGAVKHTEYWIMRPVHDDGFIDAKLAERNADGRPVIDPYS